MEEKFFEVINEFKKETFKKAYQFLISEEKCNLKLSKLGGNPYLPKGEQLPKNKNNEIMSLLIQINFDQIHLDNYPKHGILQVYTDNTLTYPTNYEIRYYENISDVCEEFFPITNTSIIKNEKRIELTPVETYMPISDYRFQHIFCEIFNKKFKTTITNILEIDKIFNTKNVYKIILKELNIPLGLIGGYADFVQDDPRVFEKDYFNECIIKLDSNMDNENIKIGDSGILNVLINEKDLALQNFGNSKLYWDCA